MNKRQSKKAFKKKYGINPEQAVKILFELDIEGMINKLTEAIAKLPKAISDYIEENPELIERIDRTMNKEINNE